MISLEAEYKNQQLSIKYNGEIVRSINEPQHQGAYRFKVEGKEYYCIFENFKVRSHQITRIYLYPLNDFKNNMIQL